MYIWYKKEKFIFAIYAHSYTQSIHSMANWSVLFRVSIFSIIIAILMNFVYPVLVIYGELIPDPNPGFMVRIINSLICLPLITPLFRSLDKVIEYSSYRVLQYRVMDETVLSDSRWKRKHLGQGGSDPSDQEQEPLRE